MIVALAFSCERRKPFALAPKIRPEEFFFTLSKVGLAVSFV